MDRAKLAKALEEFLIDTKPHPWARPWSTWGPVVFELRIFEGAIRLCWLQVLSEYSRQGWATRFMARLCEWADYHGVELTLEVCPNPRARPRVSRAALRGFYATCGFIPDGRREFGMRRQPRRRPG